MIIENILGVNAVLGTVIRALLVVLLGIGIYVSVKFSNERLKNEDKIYINKLKALRILLFVSAIVVAFGIFKNNPIIRVTFVTFIASIVIAYILNPAVNYFEKKGMRRIVAIGLLYSIIALVFIVLFIVIIPKTLNQFKNLFISLPTMFLNFTDFFEKLIKEIFKNNATIDNIIRNVNSIFSGLIENFKTLPSSKLLGVFNGIKSLIATTLQLILIPIFTFYLLLEKDKIIESLEKRTPEKYKDFLSAMWKDLDYSFSMFVRGRILMAIFVGVATAIYLTVLGIEFAVVIGIITCIADIIPYVGPFMGFVPAVLLAFVKSPIKAIWVGIMFVFVQWIENNIIGPKILGDSTGIHPLVVLVLFIIGGGMFGFVGMIFAVPVASAIKIIYEHSKPHIKKHLYADKLNK